jgi:hypothetical protein
VKLGWKGGEIKQADYPTDALRILVVRKSALHESLKKSSIEVERVNIGPDYRVSQMLTSFLFEQLGISTFQIDTVIHFLNFGCHVMFVVLL